MTSGGGSCARRTVHVNPALHLLSRAFCSACAFYQVAYTSSTSSSTCSFLPSNHALPVLPRPRSIRCRRNARCFWCRSERSTPRILDRSSLILSRLGVSRRLRSTRENATSICMYRARVSRLPRTILFLKVQKRVGQRNNELIADGSWNGRDLWN